MTKTALLIVSRRPGDTTGMNWEGLRKWLETSMPDYRVSITALSELVFRVGSNTTIRDARQNFDIADFDLVVFRTVGKELERGLSAAQYLRAKNVAFTDPYLLDHGKGKMSCSFARWAAGISVPDTLAARSDKLPRLVDSFGLKYPLVCKADIGKKGRDNYLVKTRHELMVVLAKAEKSETEMLVQPRIPNDGDYRVLVVGGQARIALLRRAANAASHLTNTSAGGTATLVPLKNLPKGMIDLAERAAALEELTVAGVDIMQDKTSRELYVLEVNRAPQIPTGAFAAEKMQAYADGLIDYVSQKKRELTVVGRAERIQIKEHDNLTSAIPAKLDTGADTSSIWASKIEEADGVLRFVLFDESSKYYTGNVLELRGSDYRETRIASSFGDRQRRYVVKLTVTLGGRTVRTSFSLADRSRKVYPLLLGRRLLKGKYLVDVSKGQPLITEERDRRKSLRIALQGGEA